MVRKCRVCKRAVANENGLCPKCQNKMSPEALENQRLENNKRRGIIGCTLESFK